MALSKPIEIRNTGLVAAYWRLTHCQIDHAAGIAEFRLHGWPDAVARAAGKAPLPGLFYRVTAAELGLPDLHAVTSAALYAAARHCPAEDGAIWFADAADA
jgi:glyoxylase-like metal-dependent hydrolase (beta-lactamase superfamily II)